MHGGEGDVPGSMDLMIENDIYIYTYIYVYINMM